MNFALPLVDLLRLSGSYLTPSTILAHFSTTRLSLNAISRIGAIQPLLYTFINLNNPCPLKTKFHWSNLLFFLLASYSQPSSPN